MKKMKMKMVKKIVSAAVCAVLLSGSVCQSSFPANAAAPEAQAEINLPADSPTAPFTPLAVHGALRVQGTKLVDEQGNPVRLTGMSTHGLAWFPQYVSQDTFLTLRDEWKTNCVRLALYTEEYNGYCSGGNKEELKQLADKKRNKKGLERWLSG